MRNFTVGILGLFIAFGLSSCEKGEGPVVEREFSVGTFNAIELNISETVFVTQDTFTQVLVQGQQNILDLLDIRVRGGILTIDFDKSVGRHKELEFYITMPDVSLLENKSSGDIVGLNQFFANDMFLTNRGSGDINVNATILDDLIVDVQGSGSVVTFGTTDDTFVSLNGSGWYNGFGMATNFCTAENNASGTIEVVVDDVLNATVNASGDIRFKGNPLVFANVSGEGGVVNWN